MSSSPLPSSGTPNPGRRMLLTGAMVGVMGATATVLPASATTSAPPDPAVAGTNALDYVGQYGRTCRAIQAAIDACPTGALVTVPSGADWTVTQSIVRKKNVSIDLTSAVLRVTTGFSDAVIGSKAPADATASAARAVRDDNFFVRGGKIDCASLAAIGVRCRFFSQGVLERIQVINSASRDFVVGTNSVQLSSDFSSYGMYMSNCSSDRPRPAATPVGSVGIEIFSTDTFTSQCVVIGAETGFALRPGSGSGHHLQNQVWARLPDSTTQVSFVVEASNHVFVDCMADTPAQYGWQLSANVWSVTWVGCKHFNNTNAYATDNVTTSVKVGKNCKRLTSSGLIVMGSQGKRIGKDWDFGADPDTNTPIVPNAYDHSITGTTATWLGTSNVPTLLGGAVSATWQGNVDVPFQRAGTTKWVQRYVESTDALQFVARQDDGSYSHSALAMDRTTRHTAVSSGTAAPTGAQLAPGQTAFWVDPATNELKLSWRRYTGDTSIRTHVIGT